MLKGKRVIALLFPGQGSQSVGMLRDLAAIPGAARLMDQAEPELLDVIDKGPRETLSMTRWAQPALYLAGLCHYERWRWMQGDLLAGNDAPSLVMLGHSVGEYAALTAAKLMDFQHGLQLVKVRGRIMEETLSPGVMAVVTLKDPGDPSSMAMVRDFLQTHLDPKKASIAAYNSARQLVIAGDAQEIAQIGGHLRGGLASSVRILPGVQCAFHSPLMREATKQFTLQASPLLDRIGEYLPENPHKIVSSVTGTLIQAQQQLREILIRQIEAPVDWMGAISFAKNDLGVEALIPLGPGSILKNILLDYSL